jgi:quercetin dioxygenase-like cupin family protein
MTTATPIIRAAGEGEQRWFFGGGTHTWKATAAETGGAFSLFEDVMTQGKNTPYHRHPDHDDMVYVLEGEILVNIEGQEHRVGPGGVAAVPRGVAHALLVTSPTARILALMTPGGSGEAFFREASVSATDDAALAAPVDFDRVRDSAVATGAVEILGPPPFDAVSANG